MTINQWSDQRDDEFYHLFMNDGDRFKVFK